MRFRITGYNACCNVGNNIEDIYKNTLCGDIKHFDNIKLNDNKKVKIAQINCDLPLISDENYDNRCNRLVLQNFKLLTDKLDDIKEKYLPSRISVVVATTNSGVEEFSKNKKKIHSELGNPAEFIKEYIQSTGFFTTVSTACSSGLKAISIARDLLFNDIADVVIVVGVDPITKVPLYGFTSLELLTEEHSNPFSNNYTGINLGEAVATFILEKDSNKGIDVLGIGETSDIYHFTTPNPDAEEVIQAIKLALQDANMNTEDIDYINLHGTGTIANDTMEANAISKLFATQPPASSTKPVTGHCLGAAASIELALCCYLLEHFDGKLFPHIFDGKYNTNLPKLNLVEYNKNYPKCNTCMCNSFGFGGTNAVVILGVNNG